MNDNPAFEYAQSQASTEADHVYFDEDGPTQSEEFRILSITRHMISILVEASGGSMSKLQALMCVFAGMSFREAGTVCSRSHEWVRLQVISIKDVYPELYNVLVSPFRSIKSLVPVGCPTKWTVEDTETGGVKHVDDLAKWVRMVNGDKIVRGEYMSVSRNLYMGRYKITRNY